MEKLGGWKKNMLSRIKALFVSIVFCIVSTITIILMFFFKKNNRAIRKVWGKTLLFAMGCKVKIDGDLDPKASLLILNHQSILDIVLLESYYPSDLAWIAKKEIFDLIFFSQSVKISKMISVDRQNKRALVGLVHDVKDRVEKNRVVAIFPEGTRGEGDKLLKFQSGAKIIAEKLDLLVQPIVLANARNILNSQKFQAKSGTIYLKYLPVINPKDNAGWYDDLQGLMQKELENLNQNLC